MSYIPTSRIRRAASGLVAAAALAAASTAFANAPGFDSRMASMVQHVSADPTYRRIPLATPEDKQWFSQLAEDLYANKITKEQFVAEGVRKYPGYDASFSTVADLMAGK